MNLKFGFFFLFSLPFLSQTCLSNKISLLNQALSSPVHADGKTFKTSAIGQRVSHQTTMSAEAVMMSPKGEKSGPSAASEGGEHLGRQAGGLKVPWQWGLNIMPIQHPSHSH